MKKRISSFIEKSFFSKTRKVKKIKRSQKNQGMDFEYSDDYEEFYDGRRTIYKVTIICQNKELNLKKRILSKDYADKVVDFRIYLRKIRNSHLKSMKGQKLESEHQDMFHQRYYTAKNICSRQIFGL